MFEKELEVLIFDNAIVIKNKYGRQKEFPRCNMVHVESFVLEMAKTGNLDDLMM